MSSDKTESASAQKLKKAREKGQIPRAKELLSAGILALCVVYYSALIPKLYILFTESFTDAFFFDSQSLSNNELLLGLVGNMLIGIGKLFVPLLALKLIFAFIGGSLIGGFSINLSKIAPDFTKISPLSGIKRIFSKNSLVEFAKNIVKISCFFAILYYIIDSKLNSISTLARSSFNTVMSVFSGYLIELLILLVVLTVLFAILDTPYQVFSFAKQMRMSKQELKDEYKQSEGNPETKGKLKQVRQQMSKSSASKKVPEADLILMNPTHYAVALKYDQSKADAPFVVAKGADQMALFIKGLGVKNNVEVIEIPDLARSIYYTTQLNQMIPSQLYTVVADLLLYTQQLKRYRNGMTTKPQKPSNIQIPENLRY